MNTHGTPGAQSTIATKHTGIDFSALHERMQWYVDQDILSSCNTLVMQGTDVVDFRTFGYMDLESRRPLTEDAIHRMYSNTKIVTSVAAMMLVEQGRIGLDDPVAEYLPAFANLRVLKADAKAIDDTVPAAGPMRIRHLLSHSAGLSYGFIEPMSVIDQAYMGANVNALGDASFTLETLCDRLAALPLAYEPGTSWRYSLATDVTARVIEVVSGLRFDAFLAQHIFEPLAMHDTGFWVPEGKRERVVSMYAPTNPLDPMKGGLVKADDGPTGQYTQPKAFLSGGGGLVSTVADYLDFVRMLVAGGEWNGARILKPETLALMRTNQLADGVGVQFPFWAMPNTVFGLGFALRTGPGADEPATVTDEYHWGGMAGTHSWMAPRAQLTGMCMTQRMPGFWHPFSHDFKRMAYQLAG
jgi:CubicO group peptidase (beta-lactamase class C family)